MEMESHFDPNDPEFEKRFENGSLNPAIFSHEAHLRLAWIHLTKYGQEKAIQQICMQLMAFVENAGAKDKYNKTVTIAAIKAVDHFIKKSKSDSFMDFILKFPRLKSNFKDLMGVHYKSDIFNSERAKKDFLEPDLLPFNSLVTSVDKLK